MYSALGMTRQTHTHLRFNFQEWGILIIDSWTKKRDNFTRLESPKDCDAKGLL